MESHVNGRKQRTVTDLLVEQRARKSEIRTDLLRIAGTLPTRSFLSHRGPWDEVARGELPYEPAEKLLLMIRDAARAGHLHMRKVKQDEMRANIRAFFATLERYALEELPEETEADVIPLLLEETRTQCSADPVEDLAKLQPTPERLLAVARAMDPQIRVSTKLRDACYRAADLGLRLVRTSPTRQLT
jgi:hypothetical protein